LPKLIDVGVTPVSEAVLPAVPVHSAASAAGEKLNPAEVEVADDAGALVAPPAPAAAAPLAVRTPPPEPADPPEPPSAWAGELHGAEVVVVVDEAAVELDFDFDFAVVVVVAAVAAVAAVDVVAHGTVVALPAACAMPFVSVPPPEAPRYGETRAPHEVAMTDNTRTPSSPAALLFTSAPRTQAYLGNTAMAAALRLTARPFRPLFETTYTHRTAGTLSANLTPVSGFVATRGQCETDRPHQPTSKGVFALEYLLDELGDQPGVAARPAGVSGPSGCEVRQRLP
jgi:hypothetical protein